MGVFLVGAGLAWLAFGAHFLDPWWLAVPLVGFIGLVIGHDRVNRARIRSARAVAFYKSGLTRLDGNWQGQGEPGEHYLDPDHPYLLDLDIFGRGSLFERLCQARTRGGQDRLAAWLRGPAEPDEVHVRQEAVAELRPALDLREDLDVLGANVRAVARPEGLAEWGRAAPVLTTGWKPWVGGVISIVSVGTLIGWFGWDTGRAPFRRRLLVQMGFAQWLSPRVKRVVAGIDGKARDLALFAIILGRLEKEAFRAGRLCELRNALNTAGRPPSQAVARLSVLVERLNWRRNQFFALFAALGLWTTQHALALEKWRATWGPAIGGWLNAIAEFEALSALSAYAYENPADPFPEVIAGGPLFEGTQLGHPLLPVDKCVCNDVCLGAEVRLLVVSGSNMSGKSTLLRTVGVNAVLALAGAPVRARGLRLSPLMVGATLRIQDSLQAGRSRFYAEISRLHNWWTWPTVSRRSCFCWTRFSKAPTRTTAGSAPTPSSATFSIAAPWA